MSEPTQLDRIEEILTEIRDRLPEPSPKQTPTMFGYRIGSGEVPDPGQIELARMVLAGEFHDETVDAMPVLADTFAREIITAAGLEP